MADQRSASDAGVHASLIIAAECRQGSRGVSIGSMGTFPKVPGSYPLAAAGCQHQPCSAAACTLLAHGHSSCTVPCPDSHCSKHCTGLLHMQRAS